MIASHPGAAVAAIEPPAMLGILGGGQLGRYFVMAARTMGYRTMVLEPDPDAPAGRVADVHLVSNYDDLDALQRMASQCAVVTTEFENPPAASLQHLEAATAVRPSSTAIAAAQDRRMEKQFLTSIGVPVAPFAVIETDEHLVHHGIAYPAILKTARLGYDGKGQITVHDHHELHAAWQALDSVACVLEQRLHLQGERSVVLARSPDGTTECYPLAHNVHVDGILDHTVVPSAMPDAAANAIAERIADSLGYVGVLAVELFVVDGALLVNELAPRPHNSGHWTLDGAATSQFEQQVRAVCGIGLGRTTLTTGAAAMVNLLGDLWVGGEPHWGRILAQPDAHLHLYSKLAPRPGRKMGHATVLADTPARALQLALTCRRDARRTVQLDH